MKSLVPSTFRTLSKTARKVDQSISHRTLLVSSPIRAYDPAFGTFVELSSEFTNAESPLNKEIRALNGGREWFNPLGPSLSSSVTSSTSSSSSASLPSSIQSCIAQKFRSSPLTGANMKLAFDAVKHLSQLIDHEGSLKNGLRENENSDTLTATSPPSVEKLQQQHRDVKLTPSLNLPYDDAVDSDALGVRLLIAHPVMPSFFRHTVILIHRFSSSEGAVGLILNQPLINRERVLHPLWAVTAADKDPLLQKHLAQHPVMIGGPVQDRETRNQDSSVEVLHMLGQDVIPDSVSMGAGLFRGGSHDALADAVAAGKVTPQELMVFAGGSVWGKGQLEGEIETGCWLCARASGVDVVRNLVFASSGSLVDFGLNEVKEPLATWTSVLQGCGAPYASLASLTTHRLASDEDNMIADD